MHCLLRRHVLGSGNSHDLRHSYSNCLRSADLDVPARNLLCSSSHRHCRQNVRDLCRDRNVLANNDALNIWHCSQNGVFFYLFDRMYLWLVLFRRRYCVV